MTTTMDSAPLIVILLIRLAAVAWRLQRAKEGGPGVITLKLSREFAGEPTAQVAPVAAPVPRASLCTGCVYAHIVRGFAPGEEITFCGYAFPQREVLFAVRECTDYRPKRERNGEERAIEGAVSFPPLEGMAAASFAVAAACNGEGE